MKVSKRRSVDARLLVDLPEQASSIATLTAKELARKRHKLYGRERYAYFTSRHYLARKCDERPQHAMEGCIAECDLAGCPVYWARVALIDAAKAFAVARDAGLAELRDR